MECNNNTLMAKNTSKKKETKNIKEEVIVSVEKTEVVEKETKKSKKKEYTLFASINDKTFEAETDDLEEAIFSLKPAILYTALTLRITRNGKTITKYLYLKDARRLFTNPLTRFIFVRDVNMLLK